MSGTGGEWELESARNNGRQLGASAMHPGICERAIHIYVHIPRAQLACTPALEGTLIAMQIENYGEFQLRPRLAGARVLCVSASFKTSGERNGIINPH